MESIRAEAKRNCKLVTDVDNFRERYKDVDEENEIEVIFPAGEIYTYDKNFFMLLAKSRKVTMIPRWQYRPDYVSFDFYGTVIYWQLILFVNRIDSQEDFKMDEVLVPALSTILQLSKSTFSLDKYKLLDNGITSNQSRFYKIFPLDDNELNKIKSSQATPAVVVALDSNVDGGVY